MKTLRKTMCKLVLAAAGLGLLLAVEAAAWGRWAPALAYGALAVLAANAAAGGLLPKGDGNDET